MEENQNQNQEQEQEVKQEASVNTEGLKNETVDTVKQVKESMKNVNVKEEAKVTKGFIGEMFKNPLGKIKEIASDASNKYFKTSIVLVIIWMVAVLLGKISFKYFTRNDCFELIGKDELTLTLGETYIDESIHAVSFGRDVSDKVYIETNLQINQDGEYYADEIGTYYIVYKVKDFKYDKLFKIQRIRLIQYVEESEDILIDEVGGV